MMALHAVAFGLFCTLLVVACQMLQSPLRAVIIAKPTTENET